MTKLPASERALRLECLKIAANVVCQLKDPKISVIETAAKFYAFIDADAQAKDDVMT